jgi:hypothetical protein
VRRQPASPRSAVLNRLLDMIIALLFCLTQDREFHIS